MLSVPIGGHNTVEGRKVENLIKRVDEEARQNTSVTIRASSSSSSSSSSTSSIPASSLYSSPSIISNKSCKQSACQLSCSHAMPAMSTSKTCQPCQPCDSDDSNIRLIIDGDCCGKYCLSGLKESPHNYERAVRIIKTNQLLIHQLGYNNSQQKKDALRPYFEATITSTDSSGRLNHQYFLKEG